MNFENNSLWNLFFILIFEPDTKFTEHKHTLSEQRKLLIDKDRCVRGLVVGRQDYRHLFANLQHFVQHYITDTFLTKLFGNS